MLPHLLLVPSRSDIALLALLIAAPVQSAEPRHPPFTLEQVMSAPFPDHLIAAPAKGRIAWTFNAAGSRNLWVGEPDLDGRGYTSRALTHYSGDDGEDIGDLEFAPDAESVVYVRGGDLEHPDAPAPNPTGLPQPPAQSVWLLRVSGGAPRLIGTGYAPAVSPRGDLVAFLVKDSGQIWIAPMDGHEPARQLLVVRGTCDSLRWAPNAQALAFTSRRDEHSFIGVYSFASAHVRYLDPSTDQDSDAAWSPDSTQIAFLRQPWERGVQDEIARRTAPPWSVRVAKVASGEGRELWKAPVGVGSAFHAVVADNQLLWAAGDRIIFPAETDGWLHLYTIASRGGAAQLLTPGAFEVEYASLSHDRATLVYSSNQDDIDRRHVWKVQLPPSGASGSPIALTHGSGIETAPVSGDGVVAVLRSSATEPLRPALVGVSAMPRDLAPQAIPGDFPSDALITPQPVVFRATDGMEIHGQLFLPPAGSQRRHPGVIFVHGGPPRQMLLGFHYMEYYSNTYALNEYLASRGFVVLSINYRLGIGYGLSFREALNSGAGGASEYQDVLGAGRFLQTRADVDPARIGLWGGSYGGYLTALGLARSSELFAAGVDIHGVSDWPHWRFAARDGAPLYEPDIDPGAFRIALDSSPIIDVKSWRSPVLFIHGDDDRNVPFTETVRLVEALRRQHVEFEQLIFPDEIHDFLLHRHFVAAFTATADFFDRRLR